MDSVQFLFCSLCPSLFLDGLCLDYCCVKQKQHACGIVALQWGQQFVDTVSHIRGREISPELNINVTDELIENGDGRGEGQSRRRFPIGILCYSEGRVEPVRVTCIYLLSLGGRR